ncbi:MAG: leucine-rich repeat protein [Marinilabiliaceae bacterium]|nr:leucine-rich repeat protein [Marinilabiliaceae bacterium]
MKSILFTSLFLCSAITAAAIDYTEKYLIDGTEYTFTFLEQTASYYVKSISPEPTTENFTFPTTSTVLDHDIDGLYQRVMMSSTSKYVTLGSKMTYLGGYNFSENTNLVTITGEAIKDVKGSDFKNCTSLTTVDMPKVQTIAGSAFAGCVSLTTISFPEITSVHSKAFEGCIGLTSIYLGSLSGIDAQAFANCNFATSKPAIRVECEDTDDNKTILTTIFGVSKWAYDSEKGVMYADYSVPVTTYNVTIDSNIANGSVESDVASAVEGAIVTVTANPASGYELVEISVVTTSSESVQVADDGTFVMPASDVTITALFSSNTVTPICGNVGEANNEVVASGNKIVASGNGTLSVYNILGKQVYSAQVLGREMVTLAKGVYIVKFADKTTKIVLK